MIPSYKPTIVRKDLEYVLNCLITEHLEEGQLTREFEKAVSHYLNIKHSMATNSFTSAMHLALLALDITLNDEIILSAYSNPETLNAINYIGAKPVLVDIEMDTYNLDFQLVQKKITKNTKVVILNHNFGIPAEIDNFLGLEIPLVEDCSFAFGAEYNSSVEKAIRLTGTFGLISVFSFDTNTIFTSGNGGMLLSNSRDLILKAKKFKFNPFNVTDDSTLQYDYRIADISAALGLSQLKIIKKLLERRLELANYYNERLNKTKYKIYKEITNRKNVYSKYTVLLEGNQEKTLKYLRQYKIDVQQPIINPIYKIFDPEGKEFPNAFHCYNKLIELPIYPSLKNKEIEKIVTTLLKIF